MNWKRRLIAWKTKKNYQQFIQDTKFSEAAKERLWQKEMLPILKRSAFWKQRYGNDLMQSLDAYPITTYEDYQEVFVGDLQQKVSSLNAEEILFWSETSGSTGKRKYFPITKSFQAQFQRTMAPFVYSLTQRFPDFFKDNLLYLVACNPTEKSEAGIGMGFISNFNYRNLPKVIKSSYALPDAVLENEEIFTEWAPLYALSCPLNVVFSVSPMTMMAFYHTCIGRFYDLLPYLIGEKSLPKHLPSIKVSKARKRYLISLREKSLDTFTFKTLWPTLTFACCWISGPCEPPAKALKKALGKEVSLIDGTYSATEGWMTVPLETGCLGGVLHPGAHIVEFIEEGNEELPENMLQSWDLQVGKSYKVYLTTAMGLVRYQLKDIVKCSGYYHHAPRLEFCYKSSLIKLEYVAISEQELMTALDDIQLSIEPTWYFARNYSGDRLVLVAEEGAIIDEDWFSALHQSLKSISEGYAYYADAGEIHQPILHQLPKSLKAKVHAQTKPRLISQETVE